MGPRSHPTSPPPPPPPHVQPRSGPVPFLRDLITQPYKQNPAAEETGGGAQVRVFLSLPSVFPAGDHHVLSYGESSGGVTHPFDGNILLVTIVAAPSRWVVVSVEARSEWDRAENPLLFPLAPGRTHTGTPSLSKRKASEAGRFHAEGHGGSVVAKAGMHCPVFWTPRAAAAGLAGAEKGREQARTRRSVGRSLAGPQQASQPRTVQVTGTGAVSVPCSHIMAAEVVLQHYLLPPRARH